MNNPLVSIIVITYNSSKYVLETLESIKNQTYDNLELIISDDCSTDDTKEICLEFINNNCHINFIKNAKFVQTQKNSGITPNYNNGLKSATGEWIKYIAGDDLLKEHCIDEYIKHAQESSHKLWIGGIVRFNEIGLNQEIILPQKWMQGTAKQQLQSLLRHGTFIPGPTIFVEKETLISLGGFDDDYSFFEDYPLFVKFTKHNLTIGLLSQALIRWRYYPNSVSHSSDRFSDCIFRFLREVAYPELLNQKMYFHYWDKFLYYNIILKDYPSWLKKATILINPIGIRKRFQKLLCNK